MKINENANSVAPLVVDVGVPDGIGEAFNGSSNDAVFHFSNRRVLTTIP